METTVERELAPARISAKNEDFETLSTRLWGVDWGRHFPILSKNGMVECRHVPFGMIAHFILNPKDPDCEEKRKFYTTCADSFGYYATQENNKLVGVIIANPSDPTTYYIRAVHILEPYRPSANYLDWVRFISQTLSRYPGVQRIEVEISPKDPSMPVIYARLGYRITGTTFNDRWGGLIRMTAHLGPEYLGAFTEKFCPPTAPKAQNTQGGAS